MLNDQEPIPFLIYTAKGTPPTKVQISKDVFTVGRGPDNDLQILDPQISRQHLQILHVPGDKYLVADRGSTSGTFINNSRIKEHTLSPGEMIVLGDVSIATLEFHLLPREKVATSVTNPPAPSKVHLPNQEATPPTKPSMPSLDLLRTEPFRPKPQELIRKKEPSVETSVPSVEMRINDRQTRFLNLELLKEQLKAAPKPTTDQTLQRLGKLYEITHALLPAKSIKELYQKWLEALFSCLPVERGAILLHDPKTDEFEQFMSRDAFGLCGPIEVSSTIIEQTFRDNMATLCKDAQSDERFASRQSIVIQKVRSVLSAPISSNLRVWGVCYLYNSQAIATFDAEDLEFLMATAREAGLVMENLELVGHLEAMVAERTAEIVQQRDEIQRKNTHILDSIRYAERIQQAILPHQHRIDQVFPENFVLFRPKDIVSGDFFWFHEIEGVIIVAVVDCTGHGVPGALMSMIGNTLLNQIVGEKGILDPASILENLHNGVREALRQEHEDSQSQDGMDVCLCRIEPNKITFAGSKRPLYYVVPGLETSELQEIKGDRKSIGGLQKEERRIFTNHEILVEAPTVIYLTTDGFADQPSPDGLKYGTRRLKELLALNAHLPALSQFQKLTNELNRHQAQEIQRDDITLLGIRVETR